MKKPELVIIAAAVAAFILFAACDSSGGGGSVTEDDLQGIWVAVGEDEGTAKAMLFDISGNEFTRIAYTETIYPDMVQEEGSKGTFSISGDTMKVTVAEEWVDYENGWASDPDNFDIPISMSGDTFTINIDDQDVTFYKKSFSNPAGFEDRWYLNADDSIYMDLAGNGNYSYVDTDASYNSSGTWSATSDMFRIIETYGSDYGEDYYYEKLYYYELDGSNLKFSWDETEMYNFSNVTIG